MILVDVNLLLVATIEEADGHAEARAWWARQLSGTARVGLPWPVLTGFVRIAGQARIWERPLTAKASLGIVAAWLQRRCCWTPEAGPAHLDLLQEVLEHGYPRLASDAHLAALAIEHGLQLCSLDHDFARWESAGLRWHDPLAA